jgi:hypothetical protein
MVTIPASGRLPDVRASSTSDSDQMVSPTNTGAVSRRSSTPRFAKAFCVVSVTDWPIAMAIVSGEATSMRPNSEASPTWALKCAWLVFIVSSVNQVLSVSVIVRPSGCWYTSPISKSS